MIILIDSACTMLLLRLFQSNEFQIIQSESQTINQMLFKKDSEKLLFQSLQYLTPHPQKHSEPCRNLCGLCG
ncbi:hypothetical protein B0A71_10895 [Flavobacterium tructae]|uniref:Uncharacterized protein n=1 Tax=Flavobacterium tructae TaxID=1114873 RepID=A0ABX4D7S8_9FLAO|nr:hypothetical protein B0A71_10895 [Flavobacterium tructae]